MSVKPKILKGFRDFLPGEMLAREKMIALIRETFETCIRAIPGHSKTVQTLPGSTGMAIRQTRSGTFQGIHPVRYRHRRHQLHAGRCRDNHRNE